MQKYMNSEDLCKTLKRCNNGLYLNLYSFICICEASAFRAIELIYYWVTCLSHLLRRGA